MQDTSIGAASPFNVTAFLRKRSRIMDRSEEPMVCLMLNNCVGIDQGALESSVYNLGRIFLVLN